MVYAVIDTATTGLDHRDHRILELAIITTDASLNETDRFETIIDPERDDLGPTGVHRLDNRDVEGAPTLRQLAPMIAEILDGQILIAHYLDFHVRFLSNELRNAGVEHHVGHGFCTLNLALRKNLSPKRSQAAKQLKVVDGGPEFSSLRDAIRCLGIARHDLEPGGVPFATYGPNHGRLPFTSDVRQSDSSPKLKVRSPTEVSEPADRHSTSEAESTYLRRLDDYLGGDGELDSGEQADLIRLVQSLNLDLISVRTLQRSYLRNHIDRSRTAAVSLYFPEQAEDISEVLQRFEPT